jgi:hypothetical protein
MILSFDFLRFLARPRYNVTALSAIHQKLPRSSGRDLMMEWFVLRDLHLHRERIMISISEKHFSSTNSQEVQRTNRRVRNDMAF